MNRTHKVAAVVAALAAAAALLTGCVSDADKASENLSTAAEQFEVQREIVGINGINGQPVFYVEGRCSIEPEDRKLVVVCKHAANDFRKHYVGLSDNTLYVAKQLEPIDVSVYHTRILIKPENILPELDLQAGKQ